MIEWISDLDMVCLVKQEVIINEKKQKKLVEDFEQQYPTIQGIEISIWIIDNLSIWRAFMLKTQAVCLYGEDIARHFPDYILDQDFANAMIHCESLSQRIDRTIKKLKIQDEKNKHKLRISNIMRRILRVWCLIVLPESKAYTRDLYFCREVFAKYRPEYKEKMYQALEWAINQSENIEEVVEYVEWVKEWLGY